MTHAPELPAPSDAARRHACRTPASAGAAPLPPADAAALLKYHQRLAIRGVEWPDGPMAEPRDPARPAVPPERWDPANCEPGAAPAAMLRLLAAGRPSR